MFIPAPGRAFIISDYSGIELSILAAMSNDAQLTYQIIEGDIHSFVANSLIGDKIEQVLGERLTKKNRKIGNHKVVRDLFKKVSYGIIYGSTGYNLYRTLYFDLLAIGITITQQECDVWVERWKHELFPGTGVVLATNSNYAVTRYYTESVLGRKRYWP
jgi:DNA polymerase I-like protein with 3'-5' exonuclease and polymerase domains